MHPAEKPRAALALHKHAGMTAPEISTALSVPLATVRYWLRKEPKRAHERSREAWREDARMWRGIAGAFASRLMEHDETRYSLRRLAAMTPVSYEAIRKAISEYLQ